MAVAGGFALSVLAIGVLWIGTPWHLQALMFVPFLLLAFAITRTGAVPDNVYLFAAAGAAPLGGILMLFRDKQDSHLMPILMVVAWAAGLAVGHFVALKTRRPLPKAEAGSP